MTGADVAMTAFAVSNVVRILAYLPQLVRIARDQGDARAVSCTTWSLFALSHLATVSYALTVIGDLTMAAVFALNGIACLAILGLTILKRMGCERRHSGNTVEVRWCKSVRTIDPLREGIQPPRIF